MKHMIVNTALALASLTPTFGQAAEPAPDLWAERCIVSRSEDGTKRPLEARIAACTNWAEADAEAVSALYYRAMLYDESGDLGRAYVDYDAVIFAGMQTPHAYYRRAVLTSKLFEDTPRALRDLDRAIELAAETAPPRPAFHLARAVHLAHLSTEDGTEVAARRAHLVAAKADLDVVLSLDTARYASHGEKAQLLLDWIEQQGL